MPNIYLSLCSKLDGLNLIKVNFAINDKDYSIACEKTGYEGSYYGAKLDGVDALRLIKFLQQAFDDVGYDEAANGED